MFCWVVPRSRAGLKTYAGAPPLHPGLLFFACAKQSKVTKRKHTPIARRAKTARSPALLAPPGRCATRIAVYSAMLRQCSRTSPGGAAVLGELKGDFTIYIYIYIPPDTRYQRHDAFRKALINLSRLG